MAGCFGSSAYDRYMERALHRYLDASDNYFEFDFNIRFRKGTVKVFCEASLEADRDENGVSYRWNSTIKSVVWSFSDDADVNLTKEESCYLKNIADDKAKELGHVTKGKTMPTKKQTFHEGEIKYLLSRAIRYGICLGKLLSCETKTRISAQAKIDDYINEVLPLFMSKAKPTAGSDEPYHKIKKG